MRAPPGRFAKRIGDFGREAAVGEGSEFWQWNVGVLLGVIGLVVALPTVWTAFCAKSAAQAAEDRAGTPSGSERVRPRWPTSHTWSSSCARRRRHIEDYDGRQNSFARERPPVALRDCERDLLS
jgi:hypothetical protein